MVLLVGGQRVPAGLPGLFTVGCFLGAGDGRGGQGRVAVAHRSVTSCCQGQLVGRCRVIRRAEVAIRAGMVIRWRRYWRRPFFRSAMTCSTRAWSRCRASASMVVRVELVMKAWWR